MAFASLPPATSLPKTTTKTASGRGLLLCLLGKPGVGKSSLLAQIPDVQFICDKRDRGILDLMDFPQRTGIYLQPEQVELAQNFGELESLLLNFKRSSKPSLVLESLVGIQAFCEDIALTMDYEGKSNVFVNYRNGNVVAANKYFQRLLDIMLDCQASGKNVILTGHAKIGTGKAVVGDDWVSQVMECSPEIARRVDSSFAGIFHIGSIIATTKPAGKVRADGMSTAIYVDINPHFPAKNRMGLERTIDYPASAKEAYEVLCKALDLNPLTFRRK